MNAPALIEPTLAVLAAEINAAHVEAQAFSSQAVERALAAGDLLNHVKAQLKHGEFSDWCKAHCPDIGQRRLQEYMRVARELPAEIRGGAYLGLNQAIRLVTPKQPAKKPAQKHLPVTPVKTATGGAYLPKPEPARLVAPTPSVQKAAIGLPESAAEPQVLDLGFLDMPDMPQLDGRFNDLFDQASPEPEHVYFKQILRPIEEIRDFIPKDLRTTEQAQTAVYLLEILTQQARLRLAWLEINHEPAHLPMASTPFNFGDFSL
jgi:hypothetical protein